MATSAYSYDDAATKEDLLSLLTNLSPTETQMVTGFGTGSCNQVLHEWLMDTLKTAGDNAYTEGAAASTKTITNPSRIRNVTQILRNPFSISDTEKASKQEGFSDRKSYEATKALTELKNDLEFAICRGCLVGSVVSTNTARRMRGVKNSLSLATAQSGVSLTESILNDYFQLVWDNGTQVTEVYGNMYIKRKISAFTAGSTKNTKVEDKRLINSVDVYEADAAKMVKLFPHRYVTVSGDTNNDIIGIDASRFSVDYLRKPFVRDLAKTGDAENSEVVCEATLKCSHPNAGFVGKSHL